MPPAKNSSNKTSGTKSAPLMDTALTPESASDGAPVAKPAKMAKIAFPATTDPIRFGTVGSPQGTPESGTPAAIAYTRTLGFDHLEIAWVQSVRVSDDTCAIISAAHEKYHVSLSIHAPYYINLNSQTADLMAKSDERLLAAARRGFLAGARDIIFHPGSYHEQPPEQVFERAKQKLIEITGILREEGADVILRPETMGKSAMFGTLEEAVALSAQIPGVLPCIDFAHLHARRGDGSFNSYAEFDNALKVVENGLGRRGLETIHIHLSGIEYGPKGERQHVPLNEADIRYRELIQALVDRDVHGVIVAEAPDPFHVADALTMQATYRKMLMIKRGEPIPVMEE